MAAEKTTAHSEAPGAAHSAVFPPFERETFPSQIFWLAICFVALYLITARLVQPRVGGIIENRKSRIPGDRDRDPRQAASRGGAQSQDSRRPAQRSARPGRKGDRRHQDRRDGECARDRGRGGGRDRGAAYRRNPARHGGGRRGRRRAQASRYVTCPSTPN